MTLRRHGFRSRSLAALIRDDAGTVAIMAGILFPVLVGGMALGAEASYWRITQRKMQQSADLAAYAAAVQLRSGRSEAEMEAAADTVGYGAGARAGEDGLVMTYPPATGARAGAASAVEVSVTRSQTRYFSLIYANEDVPISARAVAEVRDGGDACLLALDPTAGGAVTVSGSSSVTFQGCDVAANSNADDGFLMAGGAVEFTAGCVQSVGGVVATGNLNLTDCHAPREQAPVVVDPYADVAQPPVTGACADGSIGQNNGSITVTPTETNPLGVPSQRYCGGLSLKGGVHFQPGLYIVDGGTFGVNASALITGSDVTFMLTGGATISFNGNATLSLSAPTSGPLSGLLFFGDRSDVGVLHSVNGGAASELSGAFYTPAADVRYSGNFAGDNGCTQIVTRRITFIGNSSLTVDCTAAGTRRIAVGEDIALVE